MDKPVDASAPRAQSPFRKELDCVRPDRPRESSVPATVVDRQKWLEEQANLHLDPLWADYFRRHPL